MLIKSVKMKIWKTKKAFLSYVQMWPDGVIPASPRCPLVAHETHLTPRDRILAHVLEGAFWFIVLMTVGGGGGAKSRMIGMS